MSILEKCSDDWVLRRIMRRLNVDHLKNQMVYIYDKYKRMYGNEVNQEAFGHVRNENAAPALVVYDE